MILLVIVSLIPLSALSVPQNQMKFEGFDPKLIDVDNSVGVTFSSNNLTLVASYPAGPHVTTITSAASFKINVTTTVINQTGEVNPVQISISAPSKIDSFSFYFSYGYKIVYGIKNSTDWVAYEVAKYTPNCPYNIQISFLANSYIEFTISNSTWQLPSPVRIDNASILEMPQVNLSFFATPINEGAASISVLQNYVVYLPAQDYFSYFTNFLSGNLNYVYVILFGLIVILWKRDFAQVFRKVGSLCSRIGDSLKHSNREVHLIFVLLLSSVFIQIAVSFLEASHMIRSPRSLGHTLLQSMGFNISIPCL